MSTATTATRAPAATAATPAVAPHWTEPYREGIRALLASMTETIAQAKALADADDGSGHDTCACTEEEDCRRCAFFRDLRGIAWGLQTGLDVLSGAVPGSLLPRQFATEAEADVVLEAVEDDEGRGQHRPGRRQSRTQRAYAKWAELVQALRWGQQSAEAIRELELAGQIDGNDCFEWDDLDADLHALGYQLGHFVTLLQDNAPAAVTDLVEAAAD